jgi:CSLREA domain-containing protein
LRLEHLEARDVPANFTVNTLTDVVDANDGLTSLREAITAATAAGAGDHTINFAQAQQGGTITLSDAAALRDLKAVAAEGVTGINITVNGAGVTITRAANTTVQHRPLSFGPGIHMILHNLTFTNGSVVGEVGGAIFAVGNLSLTDCTFNSNAAKHGGAISFHGASLSVSAGTFNGNSASNGFGGAIHLGLSVASANIHNNSLFVSNTAWAGGALAVLGRNTPNPTHVVLSSTNMMLNEATNYGGAIYVGDADSGALVQTENVLLSNNRVVNADPTFQTKGGGIYFGKGTLDILSLTVSNNDAKQGDGIYLKVPGTTLLGAPILINDQLVQGPG